jgi:hypothetical protein
MPGSTGDDRTRQQREAVEREMRERREQDDRDLVDRVGDEHQRERETVEDEDEG